MPRYLLDVNVLLALVDEAHPHHQRCHQWLAKQERLRWASSPLTENGFVRILSSTAYPNRVERASQAISMLIELRANVGEHEFWPDDLSLTEAAFFNLSLLSFSKHLTDIYLVALAVKHEGFLVTFDRRITVTAIPGATSKHVLVPE